MPRATATLPAAHPAINLTLFSLRRLVPAVLLIAGLASVGPAWGQGVALRSVSPISESMAGAVTACPIDSAGAIHTNPATMSGLPGSDMSFGMALVLPTTKVSSRIAAGSLGGGLPGTTLEGSTRGETGIMPVPSMAFVRQIEDSRWTYGVGLFGIGGFCSNYPASLTNPVLTPQPPVGTGLGRLSAEVQILQLVPALSYELTDHVSIGFAPTLTMGKLIASPLFLGPAYDNNGDGYATYSSGVGTRYAWGGGFQAGVYYTGNNGWHLGASFKSPQWMESFRFNSEDELGRPQHLEYDLNYPLIISLGMAYSGIDRWVFSCDVRYFDYGNTAGFGSDGFDANGALSGLDWNSVMAVAFGVQHQLSDRLYARIGYSFNENPIDSEAAMYNVASPLISQHGLHLGGSYMFADNWMLSLAYVHAFENRIEGPITTAHGTIPGSSVASEVSADVLWGGVSKRF